MERIIVGKQFAIVIAVLLAVSSIILSGCTPEPKVVVQEVTVEVIREVTVVVQAPTLEPLPTYTPYPTYTPVPEPTLTFTPVNTPTPAATATPELTAEELDERLAAQPLFVVKTEYIVQSETGKRLYPDMLSGVIRNNGEEDIRDVVLAFAAWDANGLPILLKANVDFSGGAYIRTASATGINLVPGAEWGEDKGYSITEGLNVDSFLAVVKSFTTFDDEEWENPYFDEWRAMYEGKRRTD